MRGAQCDLQHFARRFNPRHAALAWIMGMLLYGAGLCVMEYRCLLLKDVCRVPCVDKRQRL